MERCERLRQDPVSEWGGKPSLRAFGDGPEAPKQVDEEDRKESLQYEAASRAGRLPLRFDPGEKLPGRRRGSTPRSLRPPEETGKASHEGVLKGGAEAEATLEDPDASLPDAQGLPRGEEQEVTGASVEHISGRGELEEALPLQDEHEAALPRLRLAIGVQPLSDHCRGEGAFLLQRPLQPEGLEDFAQHIDRHCPIPSVTSRRYVFWRFSQK